MTRNLGTVLLFSLSLILGSGCAESSREKASGDAPIISVNAIVDSPDLTFLIEERSLGTVAFSGASPASRWDDLNYIFNFDLNVPGESSTRRLASRAVDVQRDRVYMFVLTGNISNPELILFDDEERKWDETETVFELSFAHMNNVAGPVDIYFAAPGVAPVAGNEAAQLAEGERSAIVEYDSGEYVITVTASGDPQDVLYTSNTRTFQPSSTDTVFLFDQDPSRTGNLEVRLITGAGGTIQLPDARFTPSARIVHAALDIGAVDLYENSDFTNPVQGNQVFGDIVENVPLTAGTNDYTWTDAGNSGAVIHEEPQVINSGSRVSLLLVGPASDPDSMNLLNIRRPYATSARISFIQAAQNYEFVDVYLLPAGESIDDNDATSPGVPFKFALSSTAVVADSYEVTITEVGEKTVLAGPVALDLALRDVVDVLILDTVDPNVAELRILRNTP